MPPCLGCPGPSPRSLHPPLHDTALRSTPTSFLPVLSGVIPPETRRCVSCLKLYTRSIPSIGNISHTKLYRRKNISKTSPHQKISSLLCGIFANCQYINIITPFPPARAVSAALHTPDLGGAHAVTLSQNPVL